MAGQRLNLLIRVDTNVEIGIGHVMRCLALGQAWQDVGGNVAFLMSSGTAAVEARLREEGMEVLQLKATRGTEGDALELGELARQRNAAWVVVDGYHFSGDYQRIIKNSGLKLLFIDDNGHADYYCADLVLNQNIHAHNDMYKRRETYTHLMLGTHYALLRREFLKWQDWKREIPELARKVLITFGGSDPHNVTLKAMQAVQVVDVEGLEVAIVVGGSNPHYYELQSAMRALSASIHVHRDVVAMPELMRWADVGVAAAGSTCWELLFMGLPSCLVVVSESQSEVAEILHVRGNALNIGWFTCVEQSDMAQKIGSLMKNKRDRLEMSYQGKCLVNGDGAHCVVRTILEKVIHGG